MIYKRLPDPKISEPYLKKNFRPNFDCNNNENEGDDDDGDDDDDDDND